MFIKMGHRYVNMRRIESVTANRTQLMIVSNSGQHYYREIPEGDEGEKVVGALLKKINELEDGNDNNTAGDPQGK